MTLASTVATGVTPSEQTHAVALVIGGPLVHHELAVQGTVVVVVEAPAASFRVSALTRTGMMAPVTREKVLWPRTRSSEEASPEWVVIEMICEASVLKTSSRTTLLL